MIENVQVSSPENFFQKFSGHRIELLIGGSSTVEGNVKLIHALGYGALFVFIELNDCECIYSVTEEPKGLKSEFLGQVFINSQYIVSIRMIE